MKNECDIVKDLLFSYNDGVLTKTSKEFVDEHLKNCKNCEKVLDEIKEEKEVKKTDKEIDFLKKIRKKITNKNVVIFIFVLVLLIIVLFNVLVFKNYKEVASTMEIYLKDDITKEQVENIQSKLIEVGGNIELEYVSKEKELEKFKQYFSENSQLLDGYNGQNNPLPASFEIKTTTEIQKILDSIQYMPGIARINTHLNQNPYVLFLSELF